jgi:uncharacterized membrane protein required for colicin V production
MIFCRQTFRGRIICRKLFRGKIFPWLIFRRGDVSLNLYFWLIAVLSVLILVYGAVRGYHNGFVKEAEGLVALVLALASLLLISGLARGVVGDRVSTRALAIALLIVIGLLYSLCRVIFGSLELFAGLPVIRFLDEVLGLAAGAAKAFMLLYVVDYIVKIWLNL